MKNGGSFHSFLYVYQRVNVGNTPSIFFSMDSNGSPFFSGYETRPGSGHGIAGDVFGRLEKQSIRPIFWPWSNRWNLPGTSRRIDSLYWCYIYFYNFLYKFLYERECFVCQMWLPGILSQSWSSVRFFSVAGCGWNLRIRL